MWSLPPSNGFELSTVVGSRPKRAGSGTEVSCSRRSDLPVVALLAAAFGAFASFMAATAFGVFHWVEKVEVLRDRRRQCTHQRSHPRIEQGEVDGFADAVVGEAGVG